MMEYNEALVRELEEKKTDLEKTQAELIRINREIEQRVHDRTAELQAANAELEAANAELDTINRSVTHDLRSPLTEIYAYSQMLQVQQAALPAEEREFVGKIVLASLRMELLIKRLDNLSRIKHNQLHRRSFDLSAAVSALAARFPGLDPLRTVAFVIAPGVMVEADGDLLQIALNNLLSNAWKYTSNCSRAKIEFGQLEQNGKAIYFVRDNGPGFDLGLAGRLFRSLQRPHSQEEFSGAGIGLTIVQRVVVRHGGRIWAETKPGEGAAFYFTLAP